MSCEKQFLPANNTFLYCSEDCRLHDQAATYSTRSQSYTAAPNSPPQSPYARHYSSLPTPYSPEDGPDIIPRFSPTQSRSYFNSDPHPASYQAPSMTATYSISSTTSTQYANSNSSTALASLRELATALPRTKTSRKGSGSETDNGSPPKSAGISRPGSGVWNYMPFTSGSKTATPNTTPGSSYTNSQGYTASQSYGADPYYSAGAAKGYGIGVSGYGNTGGMGMDRPLPPRNGPGGYGHRPKSIDLVTPFSGGH